VFHEKVKIKLGLHTRRLVLRLARATALRPQRDFQNFQIEYYLIITLGLKFPNGHSFGPSMTHEV